MKVAVSSRKLKVVVIGLTGPLASGKGEFARIISRLTGAPRFSFSDKVREECRRRGREVTRENLRVTANEIRKKDETALAKLVLQDVEAAVEAGAKVVVVEPIRAVGDAQLFRKEFGKRFVLVAVTAPLEVRYGRATRRAREGEERLTLEAFAESEMRESAGGAGEQDIPKVVAAADFVVENAGGGKALGKKAREFVRELGA